MKINIKKTEVMRISKGNETSVIVIVIVNTTSYIAPLVASHF